MGGEVLFPESRREFGELIKLAHEIAADKPPDGMSEDEFAFYEALRLNESAVREMSDPVLKALAMELSASARSRNGRCRPP